VSDWRIPILTVAGVLLLVAACAFDAWRETGRK
jgi:hypothetical protein